jgi:protein phosphatase
MDIKNSAEKLDIIGDPHGCWEELSMLMDKLGHRWDRSGAIHEPCDGRRIVFLGDITDRGPYSLACYAYAKMMVEAGYALWVLGNHDDKLRRHCEGRGVQLSHGLNKTVREIEQAGADKKQIAKFLGSLPQYLFLDGNRLVVVHGAWRDGLEIEKSGVVRSWCLYAPTTGKTLPNGLPDRIDWVSQRTATGESPWIVYGHQPYKEARIEKRTAGIDTSCVFGGKLTALRWPEMELVDVPAKAQYDKHPTAGEGE